MEHADFFRLISEFEAALSGLRLHALFPRAAWSSTEDYFQSYEAAQDALVADWIQDPRDLKRLVSLCDRCRDLYGQGQAKLATEAATEINALLYRVKTKVAVT
jgi:hypothetical protein